MSLYSNSSSTITTLAGSLIQKGSVNSTLLNSRFTTITDLTPEIDSGYDYTGNFFVSESDGFSSTTAPDKIKKIDVNNNLVSDVTVILHNPSSTNHLKPITGANFSQRFGRVLKIETVGNSAGQYGALVIGTGFRGQVDVSPVIYVCPFTDSTRLSCTLYDSANSNFTTILTGESSIWDLHVGHNHNTMYFSTPFNLWSKPVVGAPSTLVNLVSTVPDYNNYRDGYYIEQIYSLMQGEKLIFTSEMSGLNVFNTFTRTRTSIDCNVTNSEFTSLEFARNEKSLREIGPIKNFGNVVGLVGNNLFFTAYGTILYTVDITEALNTGVLKLSAAKSVAGNLHTGRNSWGHIAANSFGNELQARFYTVSKVVSYDQTGNEILLIQPGYGALGSGIQRINMIGGPALSALKTNNEEPGTINGVSRSADTLLEYVNLLYDTPSGSQYPRNLVDLGDTATGVFTGSINYPGDHDYYQMQGAVDSTGRTQWRLTIQVQPLSGTYSTRGIEIGLLDESGNLWGTVYSSGAGFARETLSGWSSTPTITTHIVTLPPTSNVQHSVPIGPIPRIGVFVRGRENATTASYSFVFEKIIPAPTPTPTPTRVPSVPLTPTPTPTPSLPDEFPDIPLTYRRCPIKSVKRTDYFTAGNSTTKTEYTLIPAWNQYEIEHLATWPGVQTPATNLLRAFAQEPNLTVKLMDMFYETSLNNMPTISEPRNPDQYPDWKGNDGTTKVLLKYVQRGRRSTWWLAGEMHKIAQGPYGVFMFDKPEVNLFIHSISLGSPLDPIDGYCPVRREFIPTTLTTTPGANYNWTFVDYSSNTPQLPSVTPSNTPTRTPTRTRPLVTASPTLTPTRTPTRTRSIFPSPTPTVTPTVTRPRTNCCTGQTTPRVAGATLVGEVTLRNVTQNTGADHFIKLRASNSDNFAFNFEPGTYFVQYAHGAYWRGGRWQVIPDEFTLLREIGNNREAVETLSNAQRGRYFDTQCVAESTNCRWASEAFTHLGGIMMLNYSNPNATFEIRSGEDIALNGNNGSRTNPKFYLFRIALTPPPSPTPTPTRAPIITPLNFSQNTSVNINMHNRTVLLETNSSNVVLTLNNTVPAGTELRVLRVGTNYGQVTSTAGVTIVPVGANTSTNNLYSTNSYLWAVYGGNNIWYIYGDVIPV